MSRAWLVCFDLSFSIFHLPLYPFASLPLRRRRMTIKVGILGVGHMGRTHGRILRGDPRVRLCAVFDVDPQRKLEAAIELECTPAETEDSLLDQVEAVYVTVPNTMHAAAATRAMNHGKHVFCEKPFATTLED